MKFGDLSKCEWIWLALLFSFGLCYFMPGFGIQWHTPIYAVAHVFGLLALATAPRNARGWTGILWLSAIGMTIHAYLHHH
jgi:hypothetical protein